MSIAQYIPRDYFPHLVLWLYLIIHGAIISYHDLKTQKIRNKHILITIFAGILWHGFVFLWGDRFGITEDLTAVLTNTAMALAVAFGMYYANLWSPADAKWFAALVFVVPLSYYRHIDLDMFPAIALLINAYICAFLYIFAEFVGRFVRAVGNFFKELASVSPMERQDRIYRLLGKIWDYLPQFFLMAVGVAFVMVLLRIIMFKTYQWTGQYIHIKPATMFLLLFLLFNPIYRLMRIKWVFIPVLFALLTWIGYVLINVKDPSKVEELLNIGYISISLIMFRELYNRWQRGIESVWIEIDELDSRHVLSENTKRTMLETGLFSEAELSEMGIDGISRDQLEKILHHYRHPEYHGFIEIQKTIPFGPFIYFGLIATMIFKTVFLRVQQIFG